MHRSFLCRAVRAATGIIAVPLAAGLADCTGDSTGGTDADFIMITPYAAIGEMGPINEAFSATASSPWGFAHNGIDFFVQGSSAVFRAVVSGRITRVELSQNEVTGNWQVQVTLTYNSTFEVLYTFEPMTPSPADGTDQLAAIVVSQGQSVIQGETLGSLLMRGAGTHVHFGVVVNGSWVCPAPYFTADAREEILGLLQAAWPGAQLCY